VTVATLAQEYYAAREWLVLSEDEVVAQAIRATRRYAAFGHLIAVPIADAQKMSSVTGDLEPTISEWGVISPLFVLYVEFENALRLEASRVLGAEPYGRTSDQIGPEIEACEIAMEKGAFTQLVETLGINGTDTLPLPPDVFNPCLY
jgi:hypothetical protein